MIAAAKDVMLHSPRRVFSVCTVLALLLPEPISPAFQTRKSTKAQMEASNIPNNVLSLYSSCCCVTMGFRWLNQGALNVISKRQGWQHGCAHFDHLPCRVKIVSSLSGAVCTYRKCVGMACWTRDESLIRQSFGCRQSSILASWNWLYLFQILDCFSQTALILPGSTHIANIKRHSSGIVYCINNLPVALIASSMRLNISTE